MKRLLALIAGIAALLALSVAAPANAQESKIPCDKAKMCKTMGPLVSTVAKAPASADTRDWGFQAPQAIDTAQTSGNGYAMGVKPNWWTLCVANGYGPTVGGPVLGWNWPPRQPTISLQNRCDGYSVTNRMTIDNINNSGACIQYSRLNNTAPTRYGHLYSAFYIWNNNPVVFVNTRAGCNDYGEIQHNAAKGVGYILGLAYSTCGDCVMGNENAITQPMSNDSFDVNVIYEKP